MKNKFPAILWVLRSKCWLWLLLMTPIFSFGQTVGSIIIKDGINPATAEFIQQSIDKAAKEKVQCLIIHLNTPGGLLSSTRDIVSSIMKSPIPVVVYVSPSGAHAGSAGAFITLAGHIAAMSPGTNIGAAHPVSAKGALDPVMNEKGTNDAAAFIRSIADKRGRNIKWAEEAVRRSVAITDKEALENNVIDLIAENELDLLNKINGRQIEIGNSVKTLQTKNAKATIYEMGFFQKVLSKISDPNIAYILMMLGFFGILFELFSPGAIFPGIAGVIFLILAFYAMSSMPVNYAGIALIVFGIILFLLEIKVVSHGLLAIGGIVSIFLGSLFLYRTSPEGDFVALSKGLIFSVTAVSALFFFFLVTMGLKAQKLKPVTGRGALLGREAITLNALELKGQVKVQGETWNAVSLEGKIEKGKKVLIKEIEGLTLYVIEYPEENES